VNRIAAGPLLASRILIVAVAALSAGCVGQAAVRFHGSVAASPSPGYSWDATPAPGALPPIAGADVTLCICAQPCVCSKSARSVKTDANGLYTLPSMMFPGFIGVEHHIVVAAEAEGYAPVSFSFIYEDDAENRSLSYGSKALSFRLRPLEAASAPVSLLPGFPFTVAKSDATVDYGPTLEQLFARRRP
jgi:hypothetical protein